MIVLGLTDFVFVVLSPFPIKSELMGKIERVFGGKILSVLLHMCSRNTFFKKPTNLNNCMSVVSLPKNSRF